MWFLILGGVRLGHIFILPQLILDLGVLFVMWPHDYFRSDMDVEGVHDILTFLILLPLFRM